MLLKTFFIQSVLNWYHIYGRKNLPWQKNKNIYKIWISEIMLQQTQVKTVIPYFKKFIKKYPNIQSLSKASLNEILYIWSGLGYYKRAKCIYLTINIIKNKHNGKFPESYLDIINLPGIGRSTAGAILSFSLNYHFPVLDANIKRVLIRLYKININNINYQINKKLWLIIDNLIPIHNTGKFNQAMMDLGATICILKKPKCILCPIKKICLSFTKKQKTIFIPTKYFKKKNKKKKIKKKILILQKKEKILLKKNTKYKIWKDLFILPMFKNKIKLFYWIRKNKISWKSIRNIKKTKYNLSNIKLHIHVILIKIKLKIKKNKKKIWYNILKPKKIAIPSTIKKIINMI
ncbi:A/G-specific adenine glycosylase [Buchnera aphidicola (Mollitrichosiphum nigrofasciatum)]|uniref:A/G-specific adenine glycosylase n=1 Tax=Buchnera aphidicola TaxID=9 RepID=UPI0031B8454C